MSNSKTFDDYAEQYDKELNEFVNQEKLAITFSGLMGHLWLDKAIKIKIFRKSAIERAPKEIINLHHYARDIIGKEITLADSVKLAKIIDQRPIKNALIDIGKLGAEWIDSADQYKQNMETFVDDKLKDFISTKEASPGSQFRDVVLYGFGRIGRICARELLEQCGNGQQLRLRAIVTRSNSPTDIVKRASLIRKDSVHGPLMGTVDADVENSALILNGQTVHMISANDPSKVDYEKYGIKDAILIDNTGVWRDLESLNQHRQSKGVSKVLLTAPAKGEVPNIVVGVNHQEIDYQENDIFSAASCTTNAIVPILSVVEKTLGIEKGHIETIHSYTNDQNLLDNFHKKYRRGRSAAINMVITETGAGQAAVKAIPSLKNKLTSNAVRVPIPDGSLAILSLNVTRETSIEEVNAILKDAALNGELVEQIRYSFSRELVSNDIVGSAVTSIFDSPSTIVSEDKKSVVLYVWYDNEYGYTRQVIRLAKKIADVRLQNYS